MNVFRIKNIYKKLFLGSKRLCVIKTIIHQLIAKVKTVLKFLSIFMSD
jgi:hypothetical protein